MTPQHLADACANSINLATQIGTPTDKASIQITTPKGWKTPPKFPRGWLAQVKEDGTRIRYVNAMKVLAWLAANEMIKT